MDMGTALFREVGSDHSIALYWVIACCGWVRGGVFGYSDLEAASSVSIYSLRKPMRISSSRCFRSSGNGWSCAPYIMLGAILFCSRKRGVVLDGSQMPDPGLILDGVEDFVDGEPERSELLYQLVGSEWTW